VRSSERPGPTTHERLLPGAARVLLDGWIEERRHKRAGEAFGARLHQDSRKARISYRMRGQVLSLLIVFAVVGLSGAAIYLGHPKAAVAIASVNLVSLVRTLISGSRARSLSARALQRPP
jgi:hypothetical protein